MSRQLFFSRTEKRIARTQVIHLFSHCWLLDFFCCSKSAKEHQTHDENVTQSGCSLVHNSRFVALFRSIRAQCTLSSRSIVNNSCLPWLFPESTFLEAHANTSCSTLLSNMHRISRLFSLSQTERSSSAFTIRTLAARQMFAASRRLATGQMLATTRTLLQIECWQQFHSSQQLLLCDAASTPSSNSTVKSL